MGASDEELRRGRERYAERAWADADDMLSRADAQHELGGADLERLATAAYMLGDGDRYLSLLERAHAAYLSHGDRASALRCAFWAGLQSAQRGDMAHASGWLSRAERLLDHTGDDRPARGYLLLPRMFELEAAGRLEAAASVAAEAAAIGERLGDRDLFALALHAQGHMLVGAGRMAEGVRLLDEAMLVAARGDLSPIITGLVYCGVVLACRQAHELRRAREWTAALSHWCEEQPDLVAFSGRCLVHRAEIKQLEGAWEEALSETRRAEERSLAAGNEVSAGEARYRRAEIHRLRGEYDAAEQGYREASLLGREPQPGMALWRLGRGETAAATAAVKRALAGASDVASCLELWPAAIEIAIAAGEFDEAHAAADELARLISPDDPPALVATLSHARGAVALAVGESGSALAPLRQAAETWKELHAPYELGRARELIGLACRGLADEDGARLELDAALQAFDRLGAKPDRARIVALVKRSTDDNALTAREREVLRMVARGQTNRAIAEELVLSERTVDRHVSNILAKLGVPSRAAATAYAYEHRLL